MADCCGETQRYAQRWTASAVSLGLVLKQFGLREQPAEPR
jgi:hypothetical protein